MLAESFKVLGSKDLMAQFGATDPWDMIELVLWQYFHESVQASTMNRMAVAGRDIIRWLAQPFVLNKDRNAFETVLFRIAEPSEEWISSLEGLQAGTITAPPRQVFSPPRSAARKMTLAYATSGAIVFVVQGIAAACACTAFRPGPRPAPHPGGRRPAAHGAAPHHRAGAAAPHRRPHPGAPKHKGAPGMHSAHKQPPSWLLSAHQRPSESPAAHKRAHAGPRHPGVAAPVHHGARGMRRGVGFGRTHGWRPGMPMHRGHHAAWGHSSGARRGHRAPWWRPGMPMHRGWQGSWWGGGMSPSTATGSYGPWGGAPGGEPGYEPGYQSGGYEPGGYQSGGYSPGDDEPGGDEPGYGGWSNQGSSAADEVARECTHSRTCRRPHVLAPRVPAPCRRTMHDRTVQRRAFRDRTVHRGITHDRTTTPPRATAPLPDACRITRGRRTCWRAAASRVDRRFRRRRSLASP